MRSALPKVLHPLAGRPMLAHVLDSVSAANIEAVALVVGPGREDVAAQARESIPSIEVFVQTERLGTAHAALAARTAIGRGFDDIVVLFADTPLIQPETLSRLRAPLRNGAALAALGFTPPDPTGYGRLLREGDQLVAIREHKDASEAERDIALCNAGLMALAGACALELLDAIDDDNAQREFYLTDAAALARGRGWACAVEIAPAEEVMGVNDRLQLAAAEAALQRRLRADAMRAGATLIDPASVFFSWDTRLGRDVLVEPNVVFGPGVSVADGAIIRAFSHLSESEVGANASVGPFARLRPGARIGQKAKIGNFVEIKNADVGAGAAVSHLSYIGDASVGAGANIGAGAITCNYDGFDKSRTEIGERAFVGSNVSLVAPVRVGADAYIGSGSVITKDVGPDSLAVARGRQVEKPGWVKVFRAAKGRPKPR
jgi:bifunctional UDP-N-acetylglucosamine pyrophosphorylase/glucosamine-1-phosphate N-acetyltransferase